MILGTFFHTSLIDVNCGFLLDPRLSGVRKLIGPSFIYLDSKSILPNFINNIYKYQYFSNLFYGYFSQKSLYKLTILSLFIAVLTSSAYKEKSVCIHKYRKPNTESELLAFRSCRSPKSSEEKSPPMQL